MSQFWNLMLNKQKKTSLQHEFDSNESLNQKYDDNKNWNQRHEFICWIVKRMIFEQNFIIANNKQSLKKQKREKTKITINWIKRYREKKKRQKKIYERKIKKIQKTRHRKTMNIFDAFFSIFAYQYSIFVFEFFQMFIFEFFQMFIAYFAWSQQHAHHAYQVFYISQTSFEYQFFQVIYLSIYNSYDFQFSSSLSHNFSN